MLCAVCGDVAQGVNYNAVTCMSCQIFFRRNELRIKTMNCRFSDHCPITRVTRRFCTKCRLARCFAVGMRKEPERIDKRSTATFDKQNLEEEEEEEEAEEEEDEEKEEVVVEKNDPSDKEDDFISATVGSMTTDEIRALRTIKVDLIEYLAADGPPPIDADGQKTPPRDYIRQCLQHTDPDDHNNPILEWIQRCSTTLPAEPTADLPRHRLLPAELLALRELHTACGALRNPYRKLAHFPGTANATAHTTPLPTELRLFQANIRRLLRMCAQLGAFTALPVHRQVAIFQANVFLMVAVQLMAAYDRDRQCWALIDDQRKVTVLTPLGVLLKQHDSTEEAFHEHTQRHHRMIETMRHEWHKDELLFGLLTVVNLFTPTTFPAHMLQDDLPRHQHRTYVRLLSRYLSVKYPQTEQADECFHTLMQCSAAIRNYWTEVRHLFGDKFRLIMNTPPPPNTYSTG